MPCPNNAMLSWAVLHSRRRFWSCLSPRSSNSRQLQGEDAIQKGIARADKTLKNVEGAWIKEQKVVVKDGKITAYRVNMLVTFVLGGDTSI